MHNPNYSHFKAVLFDLDGTLLNTLADLANAVNAALNTLGFPPHPMEAYRYFVGEGAAMLVRKALPACERNEATVERALDAFREAYKSAWDIETRPYPGVPELLNTLTGQGIRMAVLSNKPHEMTALCVSKLLAPWKFDVVLGQTEGIARKPDPAGALEVARRMALNPEAFIYLGDSGTDMKTALAANMFAVGALWGFRQRDELMAHGAQALVEHPEDLLTCLTAGQTK